MTKLTYSRIEGATTLACIALMSSSAPLVFMGAGDWSVAAFLGAMALYVLAVNVFLRSYVKPRFVKEQ